LGHSTSKPTTSETDPILVLQAGHAGPQQEPQVAMAVPPAAPPAVPQEKAQEARKPRPPALLRTISAASMGAERNQSDSDGWEDVGGGPPPSASAPASTSASPLPLPAVAAGKAWPEPELATLSASQPDPGGPR
jgi:hypothetical protein